MFGELVAIYYVGIAIGCWWVIPSQKESERIIDWAKGTSIYYV